VIPAIQKPSHALLARLAMKLHQMALVSKIALSLTAHSTDPIINAVPAILPTHYQTNSVLRIIRHVSNSIKLTLPNVPTAVSAQFFRTINAWVRSIAMKPPPAVLNAG
jgi:hypothetical protein